MKTNSLLSRVTCCSTLLFLLVTTLFDGGALAMPVGSLGTASGPQAAQLSQISESAGPVQSFQADLFTGRAQTSMPIFVPPGRKSIQPSLNINYASSAGNGWVGMGWSLDLGFIQRDLKKGVPKYDSADTFVFSFQGVYSELVEVGSNEYRARDEALFLKFMYEPALNRWVVTDKSGTRYYFGLSAACRQENLLGTFKWNISKVVDVSGNYMEITHAQQSGQVYLSRIDYNGNETQSFGHTHRVEFDLEDRPDKGFSYISGGKIETNKRLKEIRVKVKDAQGIYQLARKYTLSYELSPSTQRSRLKNVTEFGTDGTTSLPAMTFSYQDSPLAFQDSAEMETYTGIERLEGLDDYDYIRYMDLDGNSIADLADLDGDAYPDRLLAQDDNSNWQVQFHTGSSFASKTAFGPIETNGTAMRHEMVGVRTLDGEFGAELHDMDGDGRPDRVMAKAGNSTWKVQKNQNGASFASKTDWGPVESWVSGDPYDFIRHEIDGDTFVDLVDMNADGLPDRVQSKESSSIWKIQWNTGSGFTSPMEDYGTVEKMSGTSDSHRLIRFIPSDPAEGGETQVDLIDMNGDGLPDRVQTIDNAPNWKVQWNTGRGFTLFEDFGPIRKLKSDNAYSFIRYHTDAGEQIVDLFDLNGDGLPDRIQAEDNNSVWKVQWNTGTGFTEMEDFGPIVKRTSSVRYSFPRRSNEDGGISVDMADINADGLPDRIQAEEGSSLWKMQMQKGPFPDLLSEINNGRGGKTKVSYMPSSAFDNTEASGYHRLPFVMHVVTQVEQEDGMGNSYATEYAYKGGMFCGAALDGCGGANREFRGFREVTVTDAAGTEIRHTFGQTDHDKGRLLSKEVWGHPVDEGGMIDFNATPVRFSREETVWDDAHPFPGVHFVHVSRQDNFIYDGDETSKHTGQTFTYDDYGNLVSTTDEGDKSVTGDERKTVNTYVYNASDYILNTLSKTVVYKSDFTSVVSEQYFYYDGAASIASTPIKGLLTKEEEWLNTAPGCTTPGPCANNPKTAMTYDPYGNVLTITDARGFLTVNTYETDYHLFLTQIENALGHTRQFTYDPRIGQILNSTDQNGQVTETVYDALGRVTKVITPLDSLSEPTQEFEYDLTSVPNKTTTKVKSSVPGQPFTQLVTYSFADGLGREIQRRSPAEAPDQQVVTSNVTFDQRGQVMEEFLPHFDDHRTSYVLPPASLPKASFSYDALGRRTRIDYPDGTNSRVEFDDFVKTATDQRGKPLRYTSDAHGRLVKVEEFNAGEIYVTTYEYDVLNNLTKTTDHHSNETVILHDSLSRKTGMTDPDMGTWSYAYDLNDNLVSQTDAKNQTISFTYDALNRVTLKDLPPGEADVTYTYDTLPASLSDGEVPGSVSYRTGRLTEVSDASGTHAFAYDKLGRVIMDRKSVDGVSFDFVRTYDSMGRIRTLAYPDTEVVAYTYNGFGDVETIEGFSPQGNVSYVSGVNYNAAGQITSIRYGNNVTSDYAYNPQTLRLDKILTKKPDGVTKLQDLSYAFDPVGNVSHISDLVNSMTQDFVYDDLNRLIQAAGSAYGTQNYAYDAIGNMTTKGNYTMAYGEGGAGPHAVTSVTGASRPSFCPPLPASCLLSYDANGNMIGRGNDVFAYDSENRLKQVKAYAGEEGTHGFTLHEGWNLISFTYLPENKSIVNVLSQLAFGTDYDQISYYDSAGASWKHFVNDPDFNDFSAFEYGRTYEIYVSKAGGVTFSVAGKSPSVNIMHPIKTGNNFVSPEVKQATAVSTVLSGLQLGTDYSDVRRYNAVSDTFESYVGGDFTEFEPGTGYVIVGLQNVAFDYGETEQITTFVYDSSGSRVKKTVQNNTTIYLGKDYAIDGSLTEKYIFLGDRRISTRKSDGSIEFVHSDHINSSNVLTDASGNQSALLEYDPYGCTVTHTGDADPKHKFTGQEDDRSTSLYYYGARYYDTELGRFITADWFVQAPADPQSFNRYAYARNNPIVFTDPTGNFWFAFFVFVAKALAVIAKVAAVTAAVAKTGQLIAQILGADSLAKTFGKISQIAGIVAISSAFASAAASSAAGSAQGSIEIAAPQDPEMPRAPPIPGQAGSGLMDKITKLSDRIGKSLNLPNNVARIIAKHMGPPTAYAAEMDNRSEAVSGITDPLELTVYSRNVVGTPFFHKLIYDPRSDTIWEMLPDKKTGEITVHTQGFDSYKERWKYSLQKEYTVVVSAARYDWAKQAYEMGRAGDRYKFYNQNSNEAVDILIRDSGGVPQKIERAPGFPKRRT